MQTLFNFPSENLLPCDGELYYYPHFLESEGAQILFETLLHQIHWQQYHIRMFGKMLAQPRLTAWYGDNEISYSYSNLHLKALTFTPELEELRTRLQLSFNISLNSALLNLYRDKNDSMGWHADDEKELGNNPYIASVSVGSTRKFMIKHKTRPQLKLTLPLEHGSLLIMKGSMQHHWLHAIPKSSKDCGPRINLTFRNIIP